MVTQAEQGWHPGIEDEERRKHAEEQQRLEEERLSRIEAQEQEMERRKEENEARLRDQMALAVDWSFKRFGTYNWFGDTVALSQMLRDDGIALEPRAVERALGLVSAGHFAPAQKGAAGKTVRRMNDGWMWIDSPRV